MFDNTHLDGSTESDVAMSQRSLEISMILATFLLRMLDVSDGDFSSLPASERTY